MAWAMFGEYRQTVLKFKEEKTKLSISKRNSLMFFYAFAYIKCPEIDLEREMHRIQCSEVSLNL